MQASLFPTAIEAETPILLPLPYAEVWYYPQFFNPSEAEIHFNNLLNQCAWKSEAITLFGKQVMQPRLVAWHANPNTILRYSGTSMQPEPLTETLEIINNKVEKATGLQANGVLANLYRDGKDSMGWHADDEKELGPCPVIPSLSFGAERIFRFKHKTDKSLQFSIKLASGSMLVMKGHTQTFYKHELPKVSGLIGARINLTFRKMVL